MPHNNRCHWLCAVVLAAACIGGPGTRDAHAVTKEQVWEAAKSFVIGLIPGGEFLEILESAGAIAVAIIDVRANQLQRQIIEDETSGKISAREGQDRFRRLEELKSSAQNAKNRALGGHRDQGTDPFCGRFITAQIVDPTSPFNATFNLVPGSSACYLVNPAIWGGGTAETPVTAAGFTLAFDGQHMSITDFHYQAQSFNVLGTPSGVNRAAHKAGSDVSFHYDPATRVFSAHYEGFLTNNLYPANNPIAYFSDVQGALLPDGQTIQITTTDPMLVPGTLQGQPADVNGMSYTATHAVYDVGTRKLRFVDNANLQTPPDVSVVRDPIGNYISLPDAQEPLVGAAFAIADLEFLGRDATGAYRFADAPFTIENVSGALASGTFTDIRIEPGTFQFIAEVTAQAGPVPSPCIQRWLSGSPTFQFLGPVATLEVISEP